MPEQPAVRLLGPADVRRIAAELGLRPTKQRGQNFVIDANTVRRIVRESGVGPDDVVVEVGTQEVVTSNYAGGSTVWDQLAQCESGGNWAINTGNGYYGGLQFSLSTWQAYGGPGMPHQQSRETQIAIAEKVRAATGGYGSWPHCSAQLGLPQ